MKKITTALIGITLAAMLLAGCGEKAVDGTQDAITINGETLNFGTAAFNLRYQQAETMSVMQMYGMVSSGGTLWDQSAGTDDNGKSQSYGDMVKDTIKDSIVQSVVLRQHAEEYGVEITPEIREKLDAAAKDVYEANAEALAKLGTTEDDVKEVLELSSYLTLMYDPMTADVDPVVTDEEAAQSKLSYARVKVTEEGEEPGEGEKTNEEKMAMMEEFLKAVKDNEDPSGVSFEELAKEVDEDIFGFTYTFGSDSTSIATEVIGAAAGLEDGELYDKVITTSDNYYYVVRMDKVFDEEATETKKTSILATRKQDAYNNKLQEWVDASEIVTTDAWDGLKLTDADSWVMAANS